MDYEILKIAVADGDRHGHDLPAPGPERPEHPLLRRRWTP